MLIHEDLLLDELPDVCLLEEDEQSWQYVDSLCLSPLDLGSSIAISSGDGASLLAEISVASRQAGGGNVASQVVAGSIASRLAGGSVATQVVTGATDWRQW